MSQVKIPDSVRAYLCDPAIATATDTLLDSKNDKKAIVESWEELPRQFRSYLAAHQIKAEFAHTLWDIWEAVWKPVLAKHGLKTEDFLSLENLARDGESDSSISEVWDDGLPMQRIYRKNDQQYNFGVDFGGKNRGLRLLCWLNSTEQTQNLNLDQMWLKKLDENEWRVTEGVRVDRNNEHLQTDVLIQCARNAAAEILKP